MLLSVNISEKSFGGKQLFHKLQFSIGKAEKIAIIGRNGAGKTTLFNLLNKQDKDFQGEITYQRGSKLVTTAQEHHDIEDQNVLSYILTNLPDYAELKSIIDIFPETMGDDMRKIEIYSEALEQFTLLGYYDIEEAILNSLAQYQITREMATNRMANLSGGQKRFVELVRVEHSKADIALIDEPTNHMDFTAKASFIKWLKHIQFTAVLISHDRDVLHWVDRIIEIKNGEANCYTGNYKEYLKQNAISTAEQMHKYEASLSRMSDLHQQIQEARAKKASTSRNPNPFIPLERRLIKEYESTQDSLEKPNFWIDRESAKGLSDKASENYSKYKAQNIKIDTQQSNVRKRELLRVEDLQLSYSNAPLFQPVNFHLQSGDRLQLIGRNGTGKTTLTRAIVTASENREPKTLLSGTIKVDKKLRLSVYEQEVGQELFSLTLFDAIKYIYTREGRPVTDELAMRMMSNYLFDPRMDKNTRVSDLSGGQKARLQIMKMLANAPNLLILDEPTNHLDLPSIEELEKILTDYQGALLYISHDSYFASNIGGEKIILQSSHR